MKILLLYNPTAGAGRAGKLLPRVQQALAAHRLPADTLLTEYAGHGTALAARADFSAYDAVVSAGGDGMLFDVVNGYFQNKSAARIPLGVLPLGTGNAFARDLGLDESCWREAIEIIAAQRPRQIDVARFHTQGREYYFINILALGFAVDASLAARKLKFLGNAAYTIGVVYRTLALKTTPVILEIDGCELWRQMIFVAVSNSCYTSNYLMAPEARLDDGLLDVTLLGKMSRRRLLACFPKIFTGDHVRLPEIETFRARKVRIDTGAPKMLTPDGELMGATPVEIECLPRAIEVLWQ